jgi:hypothetical protein
MPRPWVGSEASALMNGSQDVRSYGLLEIVELSHYGAVVEVEVECCGFLASAE